MGSRSNFEECCITLGPWGSSKGTEWTYWPGGFIRTIIVKYGYIVHSIEFQTYNSLGETQSSIFGEKDGVSIETETISFDNHGEYIMSISGAISGGGLISSICFKTNKKSYGPYGTRGSPVFSNDCKSGVIVGFHGRESGFLTAIGVYIMPESLALARSSTIEGKIMREVHSTMPRMVMPRDAGPWGAGGGKPWDDGLFASIKQVRVHLGELNVIYALQFEYLKRDATYVLSPIHGGADGSKVEVINLDDNDEYLIGIYGYYGAVEGYNDLEAIVSISFLTNKRVYGPYGKERGAGYVHFSSTASSGKVAGFHGRDNGFLSAIGVHMEYF